jgi:hypothetical protein
MENEKSNRLRYFSLYLSLRKNLDLGDHGVVGKVIKNKWLRIMGCLTPFIAFISTRRNEFNSGTFGPRWCHWLLIRPWTVFVFVSLSPLVHANYEEALIALQKNDIPAMLRAVEDLANSKKSESYVELVDELFKRHQIRTLPSDRERLQTIFAHLARAAKNGPSETLFRLGEMQFALGLGDPHKAWDYIGRAAGLNHPEAHYKMINAPGGSVAEKFELLQRAAAGGFGIAQNQLAQIYAEWTSIGLSVPRDYKAAMFWAKKRVENEGDDYAASRIKSMGLLAWLYFYGHASESPDYGAALQWARQAAAERDSMGSMILWKMYEGGVNVEKDVVMAEYWKLRYQSPSSVYATLGNRDWTFERMLLVSQLVIVGRAENIDIVKVRSPSGSAPRNWIQAVIAVRTIVESRISDPVTEKITVVISDSDKKIDEIRRGLLDKEVVYPIALFRRRPASPTDDFSLTYYRLLVDFNRQEPISTDALPRVKNVLRRISKLDRTF